MGKPGVGKELSCFCAARSHLAESNDLAAGIEFLNTLRQLRQRNQLTSYIGNLKFVLLPDVEQEQVLTSVEPLLKFFNLYRGCAHLGFGLPHPLVKAAYNGILTQNVHQVYREHGIFEKSGRFDSGTLARSALPNVPIY